MRRAWVFGFGLLLGSWVGCVRDEVPRDEVPAQGSDGAAPDVATMLPVGAWVRVSQKRLLSAANVNARIEIPFGMPFRVAEVVAVEGEFVELRTLVAKPEDLCATTSGVDPNFEIHFFTEIDALEPVLVTPKIVEFGDGTKLEFAAGVPVDLSGPEPSLQLGSANFMVPLAKHEIGRWFPPVPAQSPAAPRAFWTRVRPLYYGERSVHPDRPPFVDVRDWQLLDERNTLLTFADACGQFTLRVENVVPRSARSDLHEVEGLIPPIPKMARNFDPDLAAHYAGILGVVPSDDGSRGLACGQRFEAPPGVVVTWEDSGNIAGVTRANVSLPKGAHESAGKLCFTTDELALCIASDLLTRTDGPPCAERSGIVPRVFDGGNPLGRGNGDKQGAQVRQLKAEVSPGLDVAIVRRIVRAHIDELQRCYDAALKTQPQLVGSITIAFEINSKGKVPSSKVHESTLSPADEALLKCFTKAVNRWIFPKPSGVDSVSVTYPFELLLGS
jgi:hypothetical protein